MLGDGSQHGGLLPAGGDSLGSQVALAGDAFGFLAPT